MTNDDNSGSAQPVVSNSFRPGVVVKLIKNADNYRARLAILLSVALLCGMISVGTARGDGNVAALDHIYQFMPSPNCDARPWYEPVDCIVLHATAQPTLADTVNRFLNRHSRVSAHFVVDRDGRVVQMVPVEKRAWHAGTSSLFGTRNVNNYSIGIEMVNLNNGRDPFTDAQYTAVAQLIRNIRTCYAIPDARIVSHAEIALPAGRKSDPLGFDFARLRRMLDSPQAGDAAN